MGHDLKTDVLGTDGHEVETVDSVIAAVHPESLLVGGDGLL
jgi:hypothetical protein